MSAAAPNAIDAPRGTWWVRLHHALMPDYNRKAAVYWWLMVAVGAITLVHSAQSVATLPLDALLQILAGGAIAMLAGVFPVRIPRSKNSFAAGEIFIFLLVLLHGPAAAALAAAGEALVGSWRTSKRWTSRIASPTMAALAMFAAGSALQAALAALKARGLLDEGVLLVASMLFAIAYFAMNSVFVTMVIHLKRDERLRLREFWSSFGWVGIVYAGCASVATLLFLTFEKFGVGVLMAAGPIVAMLLTTLHYFFRQQEADEALRKAQAAERESAQLARHLRELRDSEERFHSAFTHASIGMALVSIDGRVLQLNPALSTLLGRDGSEVIGRLFNDFLDPEDASSLAQQFARVVQREVEATAVELRCRHRSGGKVWVALHCGYFSDPKSSEPCLILQAQDIAARRQAEGRLQHIAYHDGLTNLPNRHRFHECLTQAIDRVRIDGRRHFSVIFLDFDRFKLINDSLGHSAGDEFLVKVAHRIRENVRPNDIVARLGGDEFAILTEDIERERYAIALAERLQIALRQPIELNSTEITTSASIGITSSGFGYRTPEEVLRDADIAMYRAKSQGKARYALFDGALHAQVADQLRLEGELRRAIESGQLWLAYQPLYELESGRLSGFEALARWHHPERGLLGPSTFIPIAEESGLIVPITHYVLERACAQLKSWQARDPAMLDLRMQVNVSGLDLTQSAFAGRVARTLLASGVNPAHLTLEITETMLMQRLEHAVDTMARLQELGVGLSVDDFGTGYSSLAYLSRLPINSLKIDRSFVAQLHAGNNNSEIVKAVVTLGTSLGKSVVAEGIETSAQLAQLRALGCRFGQGFYLSHPLAAVNVDALLDALSAAKSDRRHACWSEPAVHAGRKAERLLAAAELIRA